MFCVCSSFTNRLRSTCLNFPVDKIMCMTEVHFIFQRTMGKMQRMCKNARFESNIRFGIIKNLPYTRMPQKQLRNVSPSIVSIPV